jgi:hypothetical protein
VYRLGEGRRFRGAISIMESKTFAHCCTVSMVGERYKENSLSLASLRSWGLVKNGLRVSPTLFPCPTNARRTNAQKRCRCSGATSGEPRLAATMRQASTSGFGWKASAGSSKPAENAYQGLQFRVLKVDQDDGRVGHRDEHAVVGDQEG